MAQSPDSTPKKLILQWDEAQYEVLFKKRTTSSVKAITSDGVATDARLTHKSEGDSKVRPSHVDSYDPMTLTHLGASANKRVNEPMQGHSELPDNFSSPNAPPMCDGQTGARFVRKSEGVLKG